MTDWLPGLFADDFALIFLILTVSSLFHGAMGFGFPMLVTPLLSLFMDVSTVIMFSLFPTVVINFANIMRGGGARSNLREFRAFPLFILAGSALGSVILLANPPEPFKMLLGAMTLLYLALRWKQKKRFRGRLFSDKRLAFPFFGSLAGLAAGTINVMMVPIMIYTMGAGIEKTRQIQLANLSFMTGKIAQIFVFVAYGAFSAIYFAESALASLLCIPGLLAGFKLNGWIDPAPYQRIVNVVLAFLSCYLIWQSLPFFFNLIGELPAAIHPQKLGSILMSQVILLKSNFHVYFLG